MPKHCFAVPSLLIFLTAFAAATPARQAPAVPVPAPDHSQEAFVFEQFNHKFKFENDGTYTQEEYARVRVQSDAGVQRYGLLTFSYASGTGTFALEFVRVRKPDGSTVDTPADSAQDMPSEITRQAPFYSDLREKHVAVKGLSVGDVLEYKTTAHTTKPLAPGQFWLDYGFGHDTILLHQQLEVSVPSQRAIKYISPDYKPVITDAGAYRVYTWSGSNLSRDTKNEKLDQAKFAWQHPRGLLPQPSVQITSFQSWDELARWYGDLQKDRVKPTPEIQAKASELTKGADDDNAKIHAIYNYVSLQFRYIGVSFGVGRYQPHFAAEVLANQYGDCKDKHTLLAALLNAAGIKAYPALISTAHDIDPDMPSPVQFDHVITVVCPAGTPACAPGSNLVWLDATSEVGPFQYLVPPLRGKHALVLWDDKPAALLTTPADLPFPASQSFRMVAKLDDSGTLTGNAELTTRGDVEFVFRSAFRSTAMPQWKDLAQRISAGLGFGGEVSDVTASAPEKTDEPFHLSYKYLRKDFGDWPNHRIVSPSPFISLPAMNADLASLPVPLYLGSPTEFTSYSQLQIPKGYSVELPSAVHLKQDFATFDATYSLKDDDTLITDRHMHVLLLEVPQSDFTAYEKFSKSVLNDYSAFISLSSPGISSSSPALASASPNLPANMGNLLASLPDSSSPDAMHLEAAAIEAASHNDFPTATSSLYRAVSADPKFTRAWTRLGGILIATQQTDAAMDAFRKAIAVDPKQPAPYQLFAFFLTILQKFSDAVPVWQQYVKLVPEDSNGFANLGNALLAAHRDDDAATALESAVKLNPGNASVQSQLAVAYLRAGKDARAKEALAKLLELHPSPGMLNLTAVEIAQRDTLLSTAIDFAERAVRNAEEISTTIEAPLDAGDEALTLQLANYWSTLGWLQGRANNFDQAEKTLRAAWKLSQTGMAAARLCELYDRLHKTQAAIQMCRLATYRLPLEQGVPANQLVPLLEENNELLEHLSPGASAPGNAAAAGGEIFQIRNFKLSQVVKGHATADFFVLLEFDPQTAKFNVLGTKQINGSEALASSGKSLNSVNFNLSSPDGKPLRVVKRGTLGCFPVSGCQFVLLDPDPGSVMIRPPN